MPATLNVGVLNLCRPGQVKADARLRDFGERLARAYQAMGCLPTWTCSPYQAGHRPEFGHHVAWGE
ncbi:MAG: aconitase X, partial [bacterium]